MRYAAVAFFTALLVPVHHFPAEGGNPVPVFYEFEETVAPAIVVVELPEPEPEPEDPIWEAMSALGRNPSDYECALIIFQGESSLNPEAVGDNGKSFGLGQRHSPTWGVPELPWPIDDQVRWFDEYAHDRYGGWCESAGAWLDRAAQRNGRGWW